jgi:predicted cupin superfamily sugar epimerase
VSLGSPAAPAAPAPPPGRAGELVATLGLQPHPEGGWYREVFRSPQTVQPQDARPLRAALTSIDFLLAAGQFSAWHRVQSDEAWHLLEGSGLRLWLAPPDLGRFFSRDLGAVTVGAPDRAPRHVVPAGWWQAAEPLSDAPGDPTGGFAYVGATVGPGFVFDDFAFGRDDPALTTALAARAPALRRLL